MFHHFHDDKLHSKSQGSITRDDFYNMIKFIGKIVEEFLKKKINLDSKRFDESLLKDPFFWKNK